MDGPEIIDEARLINSSLRRVKQIVKVGVLQAESAAVVLEQDGNVIQGTLDEHKYGLREALSLTRKRLSSLKFAEFREKYMINTALAFYLMVAVFIIAKRLRLLSLMGFQSCSR
jgi:hypothetical protein